MRMLVNVFEGIMFCFSVYACEFVYDMLRFSSWVVYCLTGILLEIIKVVYIVYI